MNEHARPQPGRSSGEHTPTLYLTYDGLLDPLGASQILPYLRGIAAHPRPMVVLSFEKDERRAGGAELAASLARQGIVWMPLRFTAGGLTGKLWDLARMHLGALWLALRHRVGIVHARGHAAAQAGALVALLTGARLIFDFRGLWADERVDKGGWNLARRGHRWQYHHYKRVERRLLRRAAAVVVLTEAVVPEVLRLGVPKRERITVIPCCADFDHFPLATDPVRAAARAELGIAPDAMVLGYLGSVGTMYWPDRFARLGELALARYPAMRLLAITPDVDRFMDMLGKADPALMDRTVCRAASRDEVARLLPAIDLLVSFTAPSYARVSMSPTKLAEAFAAGIPAIANPGTGDVSALMARLDAGVIVDAADDAALERVAGVLHEVCQLGGERLRLAARAELGLEVAAARYARVYAQVEGPC